MHLILHYCLFCICLMADCWLKTDYRNIKELSSWINIYLVVHILYIYIYIYIIFGEKHTYDVVKYLNTILKFKTEL